MTRHLLAVFAAVALASPVLWVQPVAVQASDACHDAAMSALADGGYTPGQLAKLPPATSAGAINRSIEDACSIATPVPQVSAEVLAERHVPVADIGAFLEAGFGQGAADVAATLEGVGFESVDIARALKGTFDSTDAATAAILADLAFPATPIADALREVYASDPPTTVGLLKQEGFGAPAVAVALRDSYDEPTGASAFWLLTSFSFSDIPEALETAYEVSEAWAIGAWQDTKDWAVAFGHKVADAVLAEKDNICAAGGEKLEICTSDFWAQGLWEMAWEGQVDYWSSCWNLDSTISGLGPWQVWEKWEYALDPFCWVAYGSGEFWREIGVPAYEIGSTVVEWSQDPYVPHWLTVVLRETGYGADQAADTLKRVYDSSADWVVEAFRNVRYEATETAEALRDAYGATKDWLVGAYRTVGYGATETAEALRDAYGATKDWTIQALHDVGHAAVDVAEAMKDAYNVTAAWLAQTFMAMGYAADVTGQALQSAYDWTADQVASFVNDLYDIADDIGDWFCGWLGC